MMQERLVVDSDDVLVVAPALAAELAAVVPSGEENNADRMLDAIERLEDPLMAMVAALTALNDLAPAGWFFGPHPEQPTAFGWWELDTAAQYVANAINEEMHALHARELAGLDAFQERARQRQLATGKPKTRKKQELPGRPLRGIEVSKVREVYAPTLEEKLAEAQEALALVSELQERGALFIHNNSGGKDSHAMLIYMVEVCGIPVEQIVSIHADLGEIEWGELEAVPHSEPTEEMARRIAEHYGVEFFAVSHTRDITLLERFTERAVTHIVKGRYTEAGEMAASPFPDKGSRYCTSEFKTAPCRAMAEQVAKERKLGHDIVHCLGLRAEESSDRGFKATFDFVVHKKRAKLDVWEWLPIQLLLEEDVFKMIRAAGQEPHWIYGEGMERASCSFCIYSSKDDLILAAKLRPDLYSMYVALERHYGKRYSMSNKYLEDITGIQADEKIVSDVRSKLVPLARLIERYGGIGKKTATEEAWTEKQLREFRKLGFAGEQESPAAARFREESLAAGRVGRAGAEPEERLLPAELLVRRHVANQRGKAKANPRRLYHLTSSAVLPAILRDGIRPGKGYLADGVHLTGRDGIDYWSEFVDEEMFAGRIPEGDVVAIEVDAHGLTLEEDVAGMADCDCTALVHPGPVAPDRIVSHGFWRDYVQNPIAYHGTPQFAPKDAKVRSRSTPAGTQPLTEQQEDDAYTAGYEAASYFSSSRVPIEDLDDIFVYVLLHDPRVPDVTEDDPQFYEWSFMVRAGAADYLEAYPPRHAPEREATIAFRRRHGLT